MHFIAEACYRRPLEPRALAYSRGGTAITMGLLFLAFCGYLINQIYNDYPLIQISSEQIATDTDTPDVEICAQNTTLTVVKCSAMYYNWTTVDIPNCWQNFFRAGANGETSKCYVFESKNRYRMATGLTYDSRNALRRLDFYWNVDSLQNITYSTISTPALAVQLFSPFFTTWVPETIGNSLREKEIATNIALGSSRATTYLNHTSTIFYYPQKYRAINPRDGASIIGLKSNFIDIMTLPNNQKDWPIQSNPSPPPPAFDKRLYQGVFSVQLAQSTIDVKTEVRQHTLLASVALAGGCYGVLTTIYILLFGMTRLTPWGLVHHIPVLLTKNRRYDIDGNDLERSNMYNTRGDEASTSGLSSDDENKNIAKKSKGFPNNVLIPWFFRSRTRDTNKTYTPTDIKEAILTKMIVRNKLQDQHQLNKMDTPEQYLLTTTASKRPSASDSRSNELIADTFDQKFATNGAETIYRAPQLSADGAPSLPPQYNTPTGSSDNDITPVDSINNGAVRQRQQGRPSTIQLDTRTTELSTRVEELELILSEYFINTGYLDQLRSRKGTILSPSAVENN